MCSTVSLVALAASLLALPQTLGKPAWSTDYRFAQKLLKDQHKPLAVFVGKGASGWQQVPRSGQLSAEAERILSQRYVCVYVDRNTAAGKELAGVFEIADGPGLVISDGTGRLQAFRHEGNLSDEDLTDNLRRFADPQRVAKTTETVAPPAPAYQPVSNPAPVMNYQPYYGGGFGGFSGGFGGGFGGGRSC